MTRPVQGGSENTWGSELNSWIDAYLPFRWLASFVAPAGGIVNDPTGHTGVYVELDAAIKHLIILWKAQTDHTTADTVSMYVNGVFVQDTSKYASSQFWLYHNSGTNVHSGDETDGEADHWMDFNKSNNLRVGYTGYPGVGNVHVGSGIIIMPNINIDSDPLAAKHFMALSVSTNDPLTIVTPPGIHNHLLGGEIMGAGRIQDITLYANNGTKFLAGSKFDFYGLTV